MPTAARRRIGRRLVGIRALKAGLHFAEQRHSEQEERSGWQAHGSLRKATRADGLGWGELLRVAGNVAIAALFLN